jgi:hypothetical protein
VGIGGSYLEKKNWKRKREISKKEFRRRDQGKKLEVKIEKHKYMQNQRIKAKTKCREQ